MSVDFNSILSKQVTEVERPKPLPAGTYVSSILRHEFGESAQKKTPYVRFYHKLLSPMPDVDQNALALVKNWGERELRNDFYLTDDAMFRLRDFIEKTLKMNTAGMTFSDLIPATTGQTCLVSLTQEINGENIYSVISSTAAAD